MAELQETVWFQSFVEHRDAARVITCCTVVVVVCLESKTSRCLREYKKIKHQRKNEIIIFDSWPN